MTSFATPTFWVLSSNVSNDDSHRWNNSYLLFVIFTVFVLKIVLSKHMLFGFFSFYICF